MANFTDLPNEIWLLIVQNLSIVEFFRFRFLNSLFFNYWMDHHWKDLGVAVQFPDSLRRLQRAVDPFVARRLRCLFISVRKLPSPSFLSVFLDSLPLLPNVTSLHLERLGCSFDDANFFQTITSSPIAKKLHDLTLAGSLEMFSWLWNYSKHNIPFPNVTSLHLDLYGNMETKSLLPLEQFLRSLAPTLQDLRILTTLDLAHLFNALLQPLSESDSLFPNLKSFILRLHFNPSLQSSPQTLHRFLHTHTNLRLLHLDLMTTHLQGSVKDAAPHDAWLAELVANDKYQLPYLQTLNVYPSDTTAGFSPLLTLIKRTTRTLTSLKFSLRYLTDEEAQQLFDAITEGKAQNRQLKSLMMAVDKLSVPFIDLLASKFPHLEQLTLWADETIGQQHSFSDTLLDRRYDPNVTDTQDVLHTWKLKELDIRCRWDPMASKVAYDAVSRAVPALARDVDSEPF